MAAQYKLQIGPELNAEEWEGLPLFWLKKLTNLTSKQTVLILSDGESDDFSSDSSEDDWGLEDSDSDDFSSLD